MSSECKLVEKLSDEVVAFRLSRKPPLGKAVLSKVPSKKYKDGGCKKLSIGSQLKIFAYVSVLVFAGTVQYLGGMNELVVELMSVTYLNYGLLHGGPRVIVDTRYGRLKGFTSVSREGREFYEFLGIPYAAPPVGELRFQPPVPLQKSWDGVRDATGYTSVCFQYDLFLQAVMGDEDCLSLNIYTPNLPSMNNTEGKLFPVIVFIHGGMYMFGRAIDFRGNHFMDEDVVVITINYRLNVFGFLNTGDGTVRGNMGLKDQVMALQFIRENVESFGGDPNKVTIWGESAGGASAQLHMLSPMSKGLFHRAIASSGFSLAHWSFVRKPREQANDFSKKVNCPTTDTEEMVSCLKALPGRKLADVLRGTHDVLHPRLDVFGPTAESGYPNENDTDTFLAEHPREILQRGEIQSPVPMISGVNSEEGLIYAGYFIRNETVQEQINADWLQHGPVLLDYEDLPKWDRDDVSKRLWNYYLGNKSMEMDTLFEVVDLFSDASFNKPLIEASTWYSRKTPMYLYMYSHRGDFGVAQIYFKLTLKLPIMVDGLIMNIVSFAKHLLNIEEPHYGTCHADEQALFFKMHPLLSTINPGHREFKFSRELIRVWSSFAINGRPDGFDGHYWEPIEPGQPFKFMKLTDEGDAGMTSPPWTSRLRFLNSVPGFQCLDQDYMNSSTSSDPNSVCF